MLRQRPSPVFNEAERLPTKARPIDALLAGGIDKGVITAAAGEAGSGKTTLAIHLALSALAASPDPAVFIDTEGGLAAERVLQISPKTDLRRILVKRTPDFESQEKAIFALGRQKASCIIVDSLVGNYRPLLSDATAGKINSRLASQLLFLSLLAAERKIPVLVTGHVYRKKDGSVGLAGGSVFSYAPKTILLLEKSGEGKRRATVLKSRSIAEGTTRQFSLTGKGIV